MMARHSLLDVSFGLSPSSYECTSLSDEIHERGRHSLLGRAVGSSAQTRWSRSPARTGSTDVKGKGMDLLTFVYSLAESVRVLRLAGRVRGVYGSMLSQ